MRPRSPEQIGRWIVVIVRWPQFVRWLQSQREESAGLDDHAAARVMALAAESQTAQALQTRLNDAGIQAAWTAELELLEFLRADVHPDLKLDLASAHGLW